MRKLLSFLICAAYLVGDALGFISGIASYDLKSTRMRKNSPYMAFDLSSIFSGGGGKADGKPVCVITGTTSGLGLECARDLLRQGKYEVVCACRDVEKMKNVAAEQGFDKLPGSFSVLPLDLGSFSSTRGFVRQLKQKYPRPLQRLVCNAAVYQPANLKDQDGNGVGRPRFTVDGIEEQLQINHLSHFLLCSLLLEDMKKAAKNDKEGARMIVVGSITGNDNTVGGGLVYPIADLGDLSGMAPPQSSREPVAMIDGRPFNGAKAYKDSKVCNMMTINELHKRYHSSTGIVFSTIYPGCIAETQLFREKRKWFQQFFPLFMKYVTGGYVSMPEAGERLAKVVDDPRCSVSGKYWGWNGGAQTIALKDFSDGGKLKGAGGSGGEMFENFPSAKVRDEVKSSVMWDYSTQITGAKWPKSDVLAGSAFKAAENTQGKARLQARLKDSTSTSTNA